MVVGSVFSYLRATRTRVSNRVIFIAPGNKCIEDILTELGLADCNPVPTPVVQARRKEELELPVAFSSDRKTFNKCVGILMHQLKYRPDIGSLFVC
eukprot:311449-Pyramimonas_sp.AAC.1